MITKTTTVEVAVAVIAIVAASVVTALAATWRHGGVLDNEKRKSNRFCKPRTTHWQIVFGCLTIF